MNVRDALPIWEQKIRDGHGAEVAKQIQAIPHSKIPIPLRVEVANLARRTGLYKYGLMLLKNDFLRVRNKPNEHESLIAEYAALLTEIGASGISQRLLDSISRPEYEMTHFYRALLSMKTWNYDRVPSEIEAFKKMSVDPYRLAIAEVNLVSAFIVLKEYGKAKQILGRLQERESSPAMLRGIISEQFGELLFFSDQKSTARNHFATSFELLKSTNNPSAIYAEKWLQIIDLFDKPWDEVEKSWTTFSNKVKRSGFWEVLRELDKYYALRFKDDRLIAKVYFGTPFEGYRQLLTRDLNWTAPKSFSFPGESASSSIIFDTESLQLKRKGLLLKMPTSFSKIMLGLTRDLYKPAAVGALFEIVYPGEYYHPQFAAQRIYKIVSRFRNFAEKHQLPFAIEASELGFSLKIKRGFSIYYAREQASVPIALSLKADLKSVVQKYLGDKEFTAGELSVATGIAKRSINRVLADELKNGKVTSVGKGKNIRYRTSR